MGFGAVLQEVSPVELQAELEEFVVVPVVGPQEGLAVGIEEKLLVGPQVEPLGGPQAQLVEELVMVLEEATEEVVIAEVEEAVR